MVNILLLCACTPDDVMHILVFINLKFSDSMYTENVNLNQKICMQLIIIMGLSGTAEFASTCS